MNRLTESEMKKANMLASMIDCSPHEWPNSSHEIQLICHGYLDRVADNQNLRERLAAAEAERDAARAASEKDREWVGRALEKQAEYLGQSQMLVAERDAARAGEARAVEALRAVVAAVLPHEEDTWTMEGSALRHVHRVLDQYEPTLDNQPPALDWLTQQRREAAAEALEEFAYDADGIEELITCNIFDLRSALRTRAALLRAGEVGNE